MDDADRAQAQIEKDLELAIGAARVTTAAGVESAESCKDCGAEIPAGRRSAVRGVMLCVDCASEQERADRMRGARGCC